MECVWGEATIQRIRGRGGCAMSALCFMSVCRMEEYGISKSDGTVVFGQLLGMCDNITFPLGKC